MRHAEDKKHYLHREKILNLYELQKAIKSKEENVAQYTSLRRLESSFFIVDLYLHQIQGNMYERYI